MNVPQSVKLAGIILASLVAYFLLRTLFASEPPLDAIAAQEDVFNVVTTTVAPAEWRDEISVRGRTKALKKVLVKSETAGVVAKTPVAQGSQVAAGDVLCKVEVDARSAQLSEARAALAKARLDYNAAVELSKDGFRSETGVASARAAYDLAVAAVERASVELSKTEITAPFDGVFDARNVEVGDFVNIGSPCGTVIQQDPFLVVGAVAEKEVQRIRIGDSVKATLATGQAIDGVVRFISRAADPATRTFLVEIEVPNENGDIRDGVTAQFVIFAENRNAHVVPHSALVLHDNGATGVKILTNEERVQFQPVSLLGESDAGVWVAGLNGAVNVIIRGQNFVETGQKVTTTESEIR